MPICVGLLNFVLVLQCDSSSKSSVVEQTSPHDASMQETHIHILNACRYHVTCTSTCMSHYPSQCVGRDKNRRASAQHSERHSTVD